MSDRRHAAAMLPFSEWPDEIRQRWGTSAVLARYNRNYRNELKRAYGRLLKFIVLSDRPVREAPSQEDLESFVAVLADNLAGSSVVWYMEHLAYALSAIYPDRDWNELRDRNRALRAQLIDRSARRKPAGTRSRKRSQLSLEEWPAEIRRRWELSRITPKRPTARAQRRLQQRLAAEEARKLDPVGVRPNGRDSVQRGWSRLLFWQRATGRLDEPLTPALLADYVNHEDGVGSAPVSVTTYVDEIYRGAKAMWPESDWGWLRRDANDLRTDAQPVRNKAAKLIPIEQLCSLGLELMDEAELQLPTPITAIQYRNGLLIALLAFRPKRVADISRLVIGASLQFNAQGRPACLAFDITKNGHSSDSAIPRLLVDRILRYLDWFRPMLLRGPEDRDYLWLGRDGAPLRTSSFWGIVTRCTRSAFGRGIGPHMFRTCYATSVAQACSELLPAVRAMLDHRDPRSIRPYQLHSESINAGRVLERQLESIRIPPPAKRRIRCRTATE